MATTHTNLTVGKSYAVTSPNDCTVTDGDGVQVCEVKGGTQGFFVAQTTEATLSDNNARLTLVFKGAPALGGNGGGGSVTIDPAPTQGSDNAVSSGGVYTALRALPAPVPEPLGATTTLLHGHVYTLAVAGDTDLSALGVELYGTAELWINHTAGSVTWPTGLWWAEGSAPTLEAGKSYAIALRNDGVKLRANVQYEDTTPAQS